MTSSRLPGEEYDGWVEAVYRVCAMAVAKDSGSGRNNPFRLGNWLDAFASGLKKQSIGMIDYYRVPGCRIPAKDYSGMGSYAEKLVNDYGIGFDTKIRYVVAPTMEQCQQISGFLFNAYSNPLMGTVASKSSGYAFYGRTFGSNTMVSNYYDDCHDVALLIVRKGFPDALPMMHEGFASYYGGLMTFSYSDLKASLRAMFASGKKIDLSNEDSFYDTCIPVSAKGSPGPVALQLKYANAITCHKSQGGQWSCVFIDNPFWQDELTLDDLKWLYTAMTRAVEKVYLVNFKDSTIWISFR